MKAGSLIAVILLTTIFGYMTVGAPTQIYAAHPAVGGGHVTGQSTGANGGVGTMGGIGTSGGTCTTPNCNANGVSQNGGPGTSSHI
jgi:hypothetical protein